MRFSPLSTAHGQVPRISSGTNYEAAQLADHALRRRAVGRKFEPFTLIVAMLLNLGVFGVTWAEDAPTPESDSAVTPGTPPPEALQYAEDRAAAANAYADCLTTQHSSWGEPDYAQCDEQRTAYMQFAPTEVAAMVVGCFEETLIGSARNGAPGCAVLGARFPDLEVGEPSSQPEATP